MIDTSTYKGIAGAAMAIISPWLPFLTFSMQVTAWLAGLLLLYYSIKEKRLSNQHKRLLIQQLLQQKNDEKTP